MRMSECEVCTIGPRRAVLSTKSGELSSLHCLVARNNGSAKKLKTIDSDSSFLGIIEMWSSGRWRLGVGGGVAEAEVAQALADGSRSGSSSCPTSSTSVAHSGSGTPNARPAPSEPFSHMSTRCSSPEPAHAARPRHRVLGRLAFARTV